MCVNFECLRDPAEMRISKSLLKAKDWRFRISVRRALVLLRTMHKEMESHYTTVYAQMNKKRLLPYASNKGAFCNW